MSGPPTEAGGPSGDVPVFRVPRPLLDIAVALGLVGLAVWFYLSARAMDIVSGEPMEPNTLPMALAAILGSLAAIMGGGAVLALLRRDRPWERVEFSRPRGVLIGVVAVVVFPAAMSVLGYYPAMALLIPVLLFAGGYRDPVGVVLCAAGFLAFTYVVFQLVLKTPLP
jgi:amino acid transporter